MPRPGYRAPLWGVDFGMMLGLLVAVTHSLGLPTSTSRAHEMHDYVPNSGSEAVGMASCYPQDMGPRPLHDRLARSLADTQL